MSLNWEKFKSALGSFWKTSSIVYVDEEGSEIPIESDSEFQEALRIAKKNKNRLKLIFYDKKTPNYQKMIMTFPETVRIFTSESELLNNTELCSDGKKNICFCCGDGDVPPKWFTNYMEKFKQELFKELGLNFVAKINQLREKEEKYLNSKSNFVECYDEIEKNKPLLPVNNTQTKKKKRISVKDRMDLSEKRDIKLSKKLEKLATKTEKADKLDNKLKLFMEEKKKLLEKERNLKSKLVKNCLVACEEKNSNDKSSSSFIRNSICFCLLPLQNFVLNLKIKNNGLIPWCSPRLECYDVDNLFPSENRISLPKLLPNESCYIRLKGSVTVSQGLHQFKCKIIEGEKKIGTEFTCMARVDYVNPYCGYCKDFVDHIYLDGVVVTPREPVDCDDDDFLIKSEKKIEQNILVLEKGLEFLDILRPSSGVEDSVKKEKLKGKERKGKTKANSDLEDGKNLIKRLEEEVLFELDCLQLDPENNEPKTNPDKIQKVEKSSSDSELSVISTEEEEEEDEDEENFIIVPLPSKSPSPAESVLDKNCVNVEPEIKQEVHPEPEPEPPKSEINIKIQSQVEKENRTPDNLSPNQLSPTLSRRSPFGEEIPNSKPKKMKSKSTEYHFTTANLTQPTFAPLRDGFYTERPSRFKFTSGEKKGKLEGVFEFTVKGGNNRKKDDSINKTVPKTDSTGRVIYAVNNMGRCLPVSDLFGNGEHSRNVREENSDDNRDKKRPERFNEIPSVNILPNALMNGASNVASMAFNTAKSVINNLQSAFVTEGKTELGKPAFEDKKKVSMENLFKLYEMGFFDLEKNRNLLLIHDNNISKVIEELIGFEVNSSE